MPEGNEQKARHWRANLRILMIPLSVWIGISFVLGPAIPSEATTMKVELKRTT